MTFDTQNSRGSIRGLQSPLLLLLCVLPTVFILYIFQWGKKFLNSKAAVLLHAAILLERSGLRKYSAKNTNESHQKSGKNNFFGFGKVVVASLCVCTHIFDLIYSLTYEPTNEKIPPPPLYSF